MTWAIEFSQEANNYAIDSHPYNEAVLMAIEQLALADDGFPPEGRYQQLGSWLVWEIAEHTIVYERVLEDLCIYIWLIKPTASDS